MDGFLLVKRNKKKPTKSKERNACKLASKLKFYLILSETTLNSSIRDSHSSSAFACEATEKKEKKIKQDPFGTTFTLISHAFFVVVVSIFVSFEVLTLSVLFSLAFSFSNLLIRANYLR